MAVSLRLVLVVQDGLLAGDGRQETTIPSFLFLPLPSSSSSAPSNSISSYNPSPFRLLFSFYRFSHLYLLFFVSHHITLTAHRIPFQPLPVPLPHRFQECLANSLNCSSSLVMLPILLHVHMFIKMLTKIARNYMSL